jgi:CubicO group peptidase (beta-lactamase class C family)
MSEAVAPLKTFPHEAAADPALVGLDVTALDRVRDSFLAQNSRGLYPGGQLVVRRHGRVVLDVAVGLGRGFRDGEEPQQVHRRTLFPLFSAGKAVVAILIALAEERGLLDPRAPIADVWPGFAANGKEDITVLDVLTHRGGVLMDEFCARPEQWAKWQNVVAAVEAARPTHRRGPLRYHPLEYGWILAEVVQRATGQGFRAFLAEALAGPAGLPDLQFGVGEDRRAQVAHGYYLGDKAVRIGSFTVSRAVERLTTDPEMAAVLLPGAGLVSDAGTLAGFYELLVKGGVAADGTRVLKEATVARYTGREVGGWDRSTSAPITLGRGFFVGSRGPSLYGLWDTPGCFGHAGMFCTVGFGDHETKVAAAIVTNGNRSKADLVKRMLPLCSGIRKACR